MKTARRLNRTSGSTRRLVERIVSGHWRQKRRRWRWRAAP